MLSDEEQYDDGSALGFRFGAADTVAAPAATRRSEEIMVTENWFCSANWLYLLSTTSNQGNERHDDHLPTKDGLGE